MTERDKRFEDRHHIEPGKPVPREPEDEGAPARNDVTPSSQGVGAIWGDAERTPHPGPVQAPNETDQAAMEAVAAEYDVVSTDEGERYLEPKDAEDEQGTTKDDFPDHG
ncbi:hypothetical protein [Sinomonas humi]|uniref:Uncharacterized protein n=1 Tax=Sinomonas humi TaxID=1338436 RepID=A0A0B2ALA4_9MICC|nr:hypothetical protein [Sinomonas humi]KHL02557.1 hypothetical protein LK10_12065 [Sinomonas humi]